MIYLAIDPGATTGYVIALEIPHLRHGNITCGKHSIEIFDFGEFEHWSKVEELIVNEKPTVLIAEAYIPFPWKAHTGSERIMPIKVLGVLEFLREKYGFQLVTQNPSIKNLTKLNKEHLAEVKGTHARDALRHLIYYLEGTPDVTV